MLAALSENQEENFLSIILYPAIYGIIILLLKLILTIKGGIHMKRVGSILLGIWLILTGVLGMDLVTLTGAIAEIVTKGLPVLAIIAGIFILIGK